MLSWTEPFETYLPLGVGTRMHDTVHVQVQTIILFSVRIRSRHVDRLRYGGEPFQFPRRSEAICLFASGRGTHDRLIRLSIFAGDHNGLFFNDRHAHLWIFARQPSELWVPQSVREAGTAKGDASGLGAIKQKSLPMLEHPWWVDLM